MPSIGSITKTIRFCEEDKEKIEKLVREKGISFNRAVHELIEGNAGEGTPKKGYRKIRENTKEGDEGTPKEEYREDLMDRAVQREIKSMCKGSGISEHDFYRGVMELWRKDKIYIEYGEVRCKGMWKMEEFEEACHRVNVYPQTMIDKIVKGLR